ncbi:hypothetical protein QYF48_12195 [Brevibacillus agri]|uniref:hypothetical protein n=1 Tax=Brevibacillus agri TaxID=51101 RepID=UPI0025B6AED6|nr:hypothetical protein [Brevibacillus agri]MDN4093576.1 hypothetical protein [Brevibacillus agri]
MANKRDTKLTLADLIAKKAAKEESSKNKTTSIYVKSLDGELEIEVPNRKIIYQVIDMTGESMESKMYANAYLVYHSVKLFRQPEMIEGKSDPVDIVFDMLEPYEIGEIQSKIMELSGFVKPEETFEELKN